MQESPPKQARREPAVGDRMAHRVEAHGGDAGYTVTQRWAWLPGLIVVNLLTLVLSAVAAIGSAMGAELFLLGLIFPQVWGWLIAPWVGVVTIVVVGVSAWIYASVRPETTPFDRRFAAGVTMGAFIAAIVFPVAAFSLLAFVSVTFAG